jgi:hypothetical protein
MRSSNILVHDENKEAENSRIEGLAIEVRVFALLRDLLGVLDFAAAVCKWGGNTCEVQVQSLTFQGENPRIVLNWLCLVMTLLKALRLSLG